MLPPVRATLAADSTANGLLSGRVYRHGSAPQNVQRPYVTWSAPAGAPENTLDAPEMDAWRIQVDCWADSDSGIEALAQAVRNALEPFGVIVAYIADERDPETGRFRFGFQMDWMLGR